MEGGRVGTGGPQPVSSMDQYSKENAIKKFEHIEKVLEALGEIHEGEKGRIGEEFKPSGGEFVRSISKYDPTGGYVTAFFRQGARKFERLDCNSQSENLYGLMNELGGCFNIIRQYFLTHQDFRELNASLQEFTPKMQRLQELFNQIAQPGLDRLQRSYTKTSKEEKTTDKENTPDKAKKMTDVEKIRRTVGDFKTLFTNEINDTRETIIRNVEAAKMAKKTEVVQQVRKGLRDSFIQRFEQVEVTPSGFFKFGGEAKCIIAVDRHNRSPTQFFDNPTNFIKRLVERMKQIQEQVPLKDDQENLVMRALEDLSGERWRFYIVNASQTLHQPPQRDVEISVSGQNMGFHKKILSANSIYFQELFARNPQMKEVEIKAPPGVDPDEFQQWLNFALLSFYTLEPLPIDESNIAILNKIGASLGSSSILDQVARAIGDHPDWEKYLT